MALSLLRIEVFFLGSWNNGTFREKGRNIDLFACRSLANFVDNINAGLGGGYLVLEGNEKLEGSTILCKSDNCHKFT